MFKFFTKYFQFIQDEWIMIFSKIGRWQMIFWPSFETEKYVEILVTRKIWEKLLNKIINETEYVCIIPYGVNIIKIPNCLF